ncbi:MAG: DUF4886 domain-containing protein, partial [Clostridiales bacterium]|nr:DUF4886 domain-containing protein [Clostridiales bacterium]
MKQSLRRGLSALLALVLVLGVLPAGAAVSLDGAETSAVILEEEPSTPAEETAAGDTENTAESEAAESEPDAGESAGEDADSGEPTEEDADTADTDEPTEKDTTPAETDEAADSAGASQEEPEEEAAEEEESAEENVTEDEEAAEGPAEDETEGEAEVAAASVTRTAAYQRSYAKKGTTYHILVIGNSYSVDSTQYLYQVATDAGYDVVVGNLQKGSLTLANHWSYAKNDTAAYTYRKNTSGSWKTTNSATMAQAVEDEYWDIIIFQQQSIAAGQSRKFYNSNEENYLALLGDYVTGLCSNSDVKIGFEMTWAHIEDCPDSECNCYSNDQMTMYQAICDATQAAVVGSGAVDLIITAGTAIQNARSSYLGDTLNRDTKHLSYGLGRYLAAMSVASACGMDLSGITEINIGSYTCSSLHLAVLRQSVADAEVTPYAVTQQSTKTPSLSQPTVTKSTSGGKTTLTWSAVSGATGYQIYRIPQSGGTAALLTTLDTEPGKSRYSYSYTATGYNYYICALGDDYISDIVDASAKVSSAPSISSLSGTSGGTLTVKWSSVSTITGYQVQIATDSAFTENVQTYKLSGTSKTISGCTNWTKYYVRVRAYRTVGGTTNYSSWSSVKNICCVNAPSISS